MMQSSQAIVQEVARSRSAIGYVGLGYVTHDLKPLAVRKRAEEPAFLPSVDTTQSKSYPISRSLHIYTAGEPEGEVKKFIDFVSSPEGQAIVGVMDFVPLKK
jgi:phosphate transport system substrate-binding protein